MVSLRDELKEEINKDDDQGAKLNVVLFAILLGGIVQQSFNGLLGSAILLISSYYGTVLLQERIDNAIEFWKSELSKIPLFIKVLIFIIPTLAIVLFLVGFFILYLDSMFLAYTNNPYYKHDPYMETISGIVFGAVVGAIHSHFILKKSSSSK